MVKLVYVHPRTEQMSKWAQPAPKLAFYKPFPIKETRASLEKQLIPGLGQHKYKMSLEHSVMAESKEMLKS